MDYARPKLVVESAPHHTLNKFKTQIGLRCSIGHNMPLYPLDSAQNNAEFKFITKKSTIAHFADVYGIASGVGDGDFGIYVVGSAPSSDS